ncbi:hypothetical protein DE146DRAFT_642740 [Phaeosphaeria sp. MPI-PUGE-AT-0046c]|nr:hypothetical protein DE146DRAFT_642740 [Phaeosphaeria sp. MPI-PUGE-AT-0046c]
MTPKIFLTGGTGYIGGSVLHTIATTRREYQLTVLLRRIPSSFKETYPNITIVSGDYDSTSLLSSHAAAADIVIHCGDSDHISSLNALLTGLLSKPTPGYLIHLSGTGIVSDWRTPTQLGTLNPKIWSDLTDVASIASLPAEELHRPTEELLHRYIAQHSDKVHIAIMCPPDIYGRGQGPGKTASALIPMFVNLILSSEHKQPFYVGDGTNTRSWVHVYDLMRLYLHVLDATQTTTPEKFFGKNGYYFAATQECSQIELARKVGEVLLKHGETKRAEPRQVCLQDVDALANLPFFPQLGRYLFASNSRTRAERAGKLFAYEGVAEGLMERLEMDVVDAL